MPHNISDYFRKNADSMDQLKTTPNAGTYRFSVGNFQLTVLSDGYGNFPATQPTWAPEATAEDLKQALESAFLPTDQLTPSFQSYPHRQRQRLTPVRYRTRQIVSAFGWTTVTATTTRWIST